VVVTVGEAAGHPDAAAMVPYSPTAIATAATLTSASASASAVARKQAELGTSAGNSTSNANVNNISNSNSNKYVPPYSYRKLKYDSFSPQSLLKAFQSHKPQFSGADQQDSQEFLCELLDAFHEDLKLLPIATPPSAATAATAGGGGAGGEGGGTIVRTPSTKSVTSSASAAVPVPVPMPGTVSSQSSAAAGLGGPGGLGESTAIAPSVARSDSVSVSAPGASENSETAVVSAAGAGAGVVSSTTSIPTSADGKSHADPPVAPSSAQDTSPRSKADSTNTPEAPVPVPAPAAAPTTIDQSAPPPLDPGLARTTAPATTVPPNHAHAVPPTPTVAPISAQQQGEQHWCKYMETNSSVISSLFQGQMCSQVTCNVCNTSSCSFEPFTTLSMPIPKMVQTSSPELVTIIVTVMRHMPRLSQVLRLPSESLSQGPLSEEQILDLYRYEIV
jgi:hypothetical protein